MFVTTVLWTAFFVINFNVAMMIPLLPFIQKNIGLTTSQTGMVLAAFPVVALISNLVLGPFIDRFGRKRFILCGALVGAIIFLLTAASTSVGPIILGRAATGLFMPMIGASVFAAIADYAAVGDRARIAGYVTTAAPVAFLVSMSLGISVGGLVAWQIPIIALAVVCLGLAGATSMLPPTPTEGLASGPITAQTYRDRLLSLSLNSSTRLLLLSYFCWSAAVFVFLGLYPTWAVQHGLANRSVGMIGAMIFLGEIGGLLGAFFSGRLTRLFSHPLSLCAVAALGAAVIVLVVPLCSGLLPMQASAYAIFSFCRDLMLALMLGGAMLLVSAAQRGSLNAVLNAIYQTGATVGGIASAWLYSFRPDFTANAAAASVLLASAGCMLWSITRKADRILK